ncbi:MAG TPA: protein kinase [Gemmatimonadaceae bacterium]|nr:protein kinase [Gemmatimonadaceae bacterium]
MVSPLPPEQTLAGAPETIGPYRVTGTLGEGGMGVVYAAEQSRPIQRRVAIKLIRVGDDRGDVVARFDLERQALAVMEHPAIAKVFDAGATASGSPYVVMEYVDGEPLVAWCDAHRLSIRERLALYLPVCYAVQHAHQKGVIHRDLKPSNVLVTEVDGKPMPKIIDFGIAKAVEGAQRAASLLTATGLLIGTPAYMSPEQAAGASQDVDTRTDVYALGVMLYELLVGSLPADPAAVGLLPFVARLAAGLSPVAAPSSRVTTERLAAPQVAARRGTEAPVLARELRGDVDAIVLKAMAPERERRYQTAQELAQDIERHLRHEPVAARAPSVRYRFGKLTRRHPAGVALAASAVIFLVGLATVMTVQTRRVTLARTVADQRRAQAEDLISFMVGDLRARLEPVGRLEILDGVGDRALAYFAAVPASELTPGELFRRSQALGQLGQLRMARGDLAHAMAPFRESLALAADLAARDPDNTEWQVGLGAAHFWMGYTHFERGALDSALAQFLPYLDISRRLVARDSTNPEWQLELGYAHSNLGSVREAQGDLTGALEAYRFTRDVKSRLVALDTSDMDRLLDLAHTENTVGRALERLGRLDSARGHYLADLSIKERLVARDPDNAIWRQGLIPALSYAAAIDELSGRPAQALARYDSAARVASTLVARDTSNADWARELAVARLYAGSAAIAVGRPDAGVRLLHDARDALRALVLRDSSKADFRMQLARAETELGRWNAQSGNTAAALAGAAAATRLLAPLAARPGAERRVGLYLAQARLLEGELHLGAGAPAAARAAYAAALLALGPPDGTEELRALDVRARALAASDSAAQARAIVGRLQALGYAPRGFPQFAARLAEVDPRPR